MAQTYEVNYQITVNSGPALESIRKFEEATAKMEGLTKRFDMITRSIGKVNSALASLNKGSVEIRINTAQAEAGLRRVLSLLAQVHSQTKSAISSNRVQVGNNATTIGGMSKLNTRSASTDLTNLMNKIKNTQTSIDNINKRYIHPKANVNTAINSLQRLIEKIQEVKAQGNITITASAAGASGAVRGKSTSKNIPIVRVASETGAGHSRYLYPTTRQVLGPTYANTGANVVGEMIKGMGIAYGLSSLMSGVTNVFRESTTYDNVTQTTKNILATHDKRPGFEAKFDDMNQTMRQVGVETKFTAPQVASAGKFLAMAGLNVDQISNSIRPIADIALVGDTDLGETADVVTNIMTSYEIPAQNMNNAADILTMTFTKTNTTLMELAESFKYAGTVAHQAGLDFETSSAAFGVLGDAGIKGSHAGTTMRMLLMNMIKPTKKAQEAWDLLGVSPKDRAGNLKPLVEILQELRDKQQGMSKGDFTQLTTTMARITAVPGFLALINNVEKLKNVEDLNRNSFGLASQLADEKKNTIQGLWYQMTSAFTETGMQQFEAMQNVIRNFLKRMIALMQSPEFAKSLGNMMEMFIRIMNAIVDVFKKIMGFWNWLPDWIKDGLVLFAKLQMTLGIIAGIGQSILSTWVMIRGVVAGQWLSAWFLKPIMTAFGYLTRIYKIMRNYYKLSVAQSIMGTIGGGLWGGTKRGWNAMSGGPIIATGSRMTNVGGKTGGFLSKAAVATPFQALAGMASWLFTNPLGLGVSAAISIGVIGNQIYKTYKATEAAKKANEEWAESYRKLGIDKLNLSDSDALAIGNMRILNNELLTQNERVRQSADLWHRYWIEKNGPKEKAEDSVKFVDAPEGKSWKESLKIADEWFGVDKAFTPIVAALSGKITSENIGSGQSPMYQNTLNLFGQNMSWASRNAGINEEAAVQIQLAKMGADPNNKQKYELEKYLAQKSWSVHSYEDFQKLLAAARERFVPSLTQVDNKWNWISSEAAEEMTEADIQSSLRYILALQSNMQGVFDVYNNLVGSILQKVDAGQTVSPMEVQNVLFKRFGWLFDPSHGLFGSESWINKIKQAYKNPKLFGLNENSTSEEISGYITKVFEDLLTFFNSLDSKYKPLFAQFIYRNPFEQLVNANSNALLPEGGVIGGSKLGDKMTINGVTYTWTQSGVELTPNWRDKNGNIYTPSDVKNPIKWNPDDTNNNLMQTLHNGADQSQYQSHYDKTTAAPKQIIVRIENLMRVDNQTIDMTDDRQVAAINNIKQELATALLDVVQDFNANMV